MFRFFDKAAYDFLRVRKYAYLITALIAVLGLADLALRGLNESIEFTGGALIQIHATDPAITIGRLRGALTANGITGIELNTFGTEHDFELRAPITAGAGEDAGVQETARAVDSTLTRAFGAGSYTRERAEAISPKVGGELRTKALLAILLSFGATLIYLTFRFEWRFAIAAIAATAHDIIVTVSFLALMNLEVSLVVVAAVLTIVGYSMNDTIIVFDRVRENLRKYKRGQIYDILNLSVNEVLPRTVLTGGTTLAAVLALLIFGGAVIRSFAWMMTFGIIVGTFSSWYIASPVLLWIERRWPGEDVHGTRALAPAARGASQAS
jgi:preprotein translocase SecF subunit